MFAGNADLHFRHFFVFLVIADRSGADASAFRVSGIVVGDHRRAALPVSFAIAVVAALGFLHQTCCG